MSRVTYEALVRDLQRVGTVELKEEPLTGSVDEATEQFRYNELERKEAREWWGQKQETVDDSRWRDWLWIIPAGVAVVLFAR